MNIRKFLIILFAGMIIMIITGATGFYWADMQPNPTPSTSVSKKPNPSKPSTDSENFDTSTVRYSDWDSFLNYEGERKVMIGIKKKFNSVNFRGGPGTNYGVRSKPSGGELLVLIDRVGSWYRARRRDGQIGWIHKSIVRKLKVPKPIAQKFEEELPNLKKSTDELIPEEFEKHNQLEVTDKTVNLRQGPGTQFSIVNRLYRFERVRLLGKRGDWYRIKNFYGQTGWVYSDLVEPIWLTPEDKRKTIVLADSSLRMGPEYQYRKRGGQQRTVEAQLLEQIDKWYQVKVPGGNIGWKPEEEIKKLPQDQTESPSPQVR